MFLRIVAVLLAIAGLGGIGLALNAGLAPKPVQQDATGEVRTPAPPSAHILAAARPLRAGSLLVAEDLGTSAVAPGREPPGSFADNLTTRSALRGAMIRRSLAANEPMLAGDVLNPGDRGFLAAVLGSGMRAVTIGVDMVSGTAGLIWPGDRVDLVLTQAIDDKDQPSDRRIVGETVLTNMRVIAVDQQLIQGAGAGGNPTPPANRTVTLEASSFDAARIAVAGRLGKLSLVVRSAADDRLDSGATTAVTPVTAAPATVSAPIAWGGDVSPALRDRPTGKSGVTIRVFRGGKDTEEVKF